VLDFRHMPRERDASRFVSRLCTVTRCEGGNSVNPDVSAQRPTMGFKNGDRVRYSHTNGLVQESTVLATRLLHCWAKRLAMQRFISTRMRSARKSHNFNGFLEWDHGTYFSSNQDQHGTGCITRCLHFRTKWTTMFGEIEIGVW
jgi:hypothetical protein